MNALLSLWLAPSKMKNFVNSAALQKSLLHTTEENHPLSSSKLLCSSFVNIFNEITKSSEVIFIRSILIWTSMYTVNHTQHLKGPLYKVERYHQQL